MRIFRWKIFQILASIVTKPIVLVVIVGAIVCYILSGIAHLFTGSRNRSPY